jgi:hypothetical protein
LTVRTYVDGCLSCDILSGKLSPPGGVIYEDDYWHVDSVIGPVVWRGFLIVKLTRFGIRKWLTSDEDVARMADLLRRRMSTLHSTEMLERDDL